MTQFLLIPEKHFLDKRLTHSDFHVLCTLRSFKNKEDKVFYVKQEIISKRCGLSTATISRSIKRLEENGFIKKQKSFYNGDLWFRYINGYSLNDDIKPPFAKVPFELLNQNLSSTAFKLVCYLYHKSNKLVAFPSLKELTRDLCISLPTIITGIKLLERLKLIFKSLYINKFHSFARNQYAVLQNTFHNEMKYVNLLQGRKKVTVCCYKFTQIDLKAQYEYLKGVETVYS